MITNPLKIGVVGTGHMAATYAQTANTLDDVVVSAVLSGDEDRAKQFASSYGGQGYSDRDAFLASVDAVYVATEPHRHFDTASAALDAGKPVLVEKPLTPDAAATTDLLERAGDTLLVEALWTLTLPAYVAFRDALRSGDYGAAKRLQFDFSLPADAATMPQLFTKEDGGVLRDRAIYGVAAALDLLGPVTDQQAHIQRNPDGIDTAATLTLTHASEATSLLTFSFDGVGDNHLNLSCAFGHLRMPALEGEVIETKMFRPKPRTPLSATPSLATRMKQRPTLRRFKRTFGLSRARTHSFGTHPYAPMLAHFVDLVRQGQSTSPVITPDLMRQAAQLIDQARRG